MKVCHFAAPLQARDRRWLLAGAACFANAGMALVPSAAFATTTLPGQFFGQSASVEAVGVVGPLSLGIGNAAFESCPCNGTNGVKRTNTVSTVSIGPSGATVSALTDTSTAYSLKTATTAVTSQTSSISKVNLLNGLITADLVKAVATVNATTSKLTPTFNGSTLTNLVIAGQPVSASVKPNTKIALSGLGSVTVKFFRTGTYGTQAAGIEVEMLRVQVDQSNSLNLPVGTVLIVGEASAGFNRDQPAAVLGGFAESLAVTADAGTLLQEAAATGAFAGIGSCSGTNGAPVTQSVANITAQGLLALGTNTSTATAGPVGNANVAKTSSSIANVSLLGGLITANGINAVAQESRTGTVSTPSTAGSSFDSLVVSGVTIANNVAPNTVISLSNLGYVVLNEQPTPGNGSLQVNGLHIVVSVANQLGLAVGTQIFVSHAEATATAF